MAPATDSASNQRENQLNGIYLVGLLATLVFVTVTFIALIVVFLIRSRVTVNWSHIYLPPLLWADTLILVASSITYERAHQRLRAGEQTAFYHGILWTTALGVLFLIGQLVCWWQILASGQPLVRNPHSSFFFLFSGLHAAHILVGLAGLGVLLARTKEPASGPKWQMTTRVWANAVAIFWHYLDVLWVLLFLLLVLIKR